MEEDLPSNDLSDAVTPQPAVDSGDERRQAIRSTAESATEEVGSPNGEGSVRVSQCPQLDDGGERRSAAGEENLSAVGEERPQVDEIDERVCSLQEAEKVPVFEPAVAVDEVMQENVEEKGFGVNEQLDWERLELAERDEKASSLKEEEEETVPILEHSVVDEVMQENFEENILDVDEPNPIEQLGGERQQLAEGDGIVSSWKEEEEENGAVLEHSVADEFMRENAEEKLSDVAGPHLSDEPTGERPELAQGSEKVHSLQEALVKKDEEEGLVEKKREDKVLESDEVIQENVEEKLSDFDGPHPVVLLNDEMTQLMNKNDEKLSSLREEVIGKEEKVPVSKPSVPAAVDDVIVKENVEQKLSEEQLNEDRTESAAKGKQVSLSQQGLVEEDVKVSSSQEASADNDEKVSALQEDSSEKEKEESEKEKEESDEKEEAEEMDVDDGGPAMAAGKRTGSKRKRGCPKVAQGRRTRTPSKPKEDEELCFICFDGGDLVVCDHKGCPKVYHPSCVNRDEAYFKAKGQWSCGWHICSNCQKSARYMCYTCTYSVCKRCIKEADFVCVRENKGFCDTCMKTVMLIEMNKHSDETTDVVDFDDKSSWMYLFKDYWVDLKVKLSLTTEELTAARNPLKETACGNDKPTDRKRAAQGNEQPLGKPGNTSDGQGGSSSGSSRCYKESTSSSKKVKKRSRNITNKERQVREARVKQTSTSVGIEWASKDLLALVSHMKDGDRSVLSQFDVQNLLLEYIKQNNLRDLRRKSQIICDSMLLDLFGKSSVGHLEMLKLLKPHFLIKEVSPLATDENQCGVVDPDPSQTDTDGNSDTSTKVTLDIRRKSHKRVEEKGPTNLVDYAAIDVHNVSLMYLRRNLMEDFLDDVDMFNENVVGSFVRIRISGSASNKDMYRLVQIVGTGKAAEKYKTGKKTTDITLEVLSLSRREVITIDLISNQDFTTEECKRLRQSVKYGFIDRLTVAEVQEKARALHAVRVNDWIESEKLRLGHLRDRASEKGRKKEHRECVEKLQLLGTPEERIRRLDEVPEVHVDPNMDPDCDSTEDEDDQNAKRRDNNKVPKYSFKDRDGFSAGRENSATRGNLYAAMVTNRNTPKAGIHDTVLPAVHADRTDGLRNQGSGPVSNPKTPKAETNTTCMDTGVLKNAQPVMEPAQPCGVLPETALQPLSASVVSCNASETEKMWHYKDPAGQIQGPFAMTQLRKWNASKFFPANLRIWRTSEKQEDSSILLTDALSGKFHKDLQHPEPQHSNTTLPTNVAALPDSRVNNMGCGVRVNNLPPTAASLPATGNYNLAKSDRRAAQPSSSYTTNMVKAGPMDGRPATTSTGWESSKNSNTWSGESQTNNSPRSMIPSSRYSSQQPSFQGRDGRGENNGRWNGGRGCQNNWNSNSRQSNWNSNTSRRFQPNDRGYERRHPYQNSSRQQFPGEQQKVQPAHDSSNQLGSSSFNPSAHAPQPSNIDWAGLQGALNKILPSAPSGQPMSSGPSAIPRGNEVQQTPFKLTSPTMNLVGGLASNSVPNVNPAKTKVNVGVLSNFQQQSMPTEPAALVTSGHNAVHSVSSTTELVDGSSRRQRLDSDSSNTPPNGDPTSGSIQPASQLNETGDRSVPLNEVDTNKKCPEAHDVSASENRVVNGTVIDPASVAPDTLGSSNLPDASVSVQRLEASSFGAQSKSQCWVPASAQQQGPNNFSVNASQPLNMGWGMVQHTPNLGTTTAQEIGCVVHPATPGATNMGWGMMAHGLMNMTWGTPANLNMGWGPQAQAVMNPNLGWAIPAQGNANANLAWGAQAQANPNSGWVMPMQVNPALNPGWVAPGIGNANPNPSWVAPTEGNANQTATWVSPMQGTGHGCTNSAVNQNGSGGQTNSTNKGGSSHPPTSQGGVCKFHEGGHCKKGASCNYIHL